jgi:hypothetical protein
VLAFYTNVVSLRRFIKHYVHWQTESCKLTFKGKTFALTLIVFDQWVLEYNLLAETLVEAEVIFATAQRSQKPKPDMPGTLDE